MPDTQLILGLVGDVLYHLFCPYHGPFFMAASPEEANSVAAAHIRREHSDAEGTVAPGAEVHVTAVVHTRTSHLAQIETPPAKEKPASTI
jgi:hypothetical protein